MKKMLALASFILLAVTPQLKAQEKCISEHMFQEAAAKDPSLIDRRNKMDAYVRQFIADKKASASANRSSSSTPPLYIIPVVVHVIHTYGTENISNAQILDQIRILNEDYRRLNADTVNTPIGFKALGGDSNIEFRMATKDPQGNCTDGIIRVYSPLTDNARDNVKALSYWPRNKYLNVWITRSIANLNNTAGDVIGFAQFPGGAWATDGVVCRYDYYGSIGAAFAPQGMGRTATHEVGHWLSMRHIWGDDAGACTQDDNIPDTPLQGDWNLSTCPSYPEYDNCTTSGAGLMFSNYMDYTNGDCQNIFSIDQCSAMEAILLGDTARFKLWQPSNLAATGTDVASACSASGVAPKADFDPRPRFVCAGGSLTFSDVSWGGQATSRLWTFSGGSPATDTSANPTVTYSTPGTYDVTLTVTNANGSDTKSVVGSVVVSPLYTAVKAPYSEGFETGTFPFTDWYVLNTNGGTSWVQASTGATGTKSVMINNYTGNTGKGSDELITPALDLDSVTANCKLRFKVAFALKSASLTNTDRLEIFVSNTCGQTWTLRGSRTGSTLTSTANPVSFTFTPTAAQWKADSIVIPTSYLKANTRFRFVFTHDTGNNIYLDDINVTGTIIPVGLEQINGGNAFNVYPNPSSSVTYVDFSIDRNELVRFDVLDASGRLISSTEENLPAGQHQYQMSDQLAKGVYFLRLTVGDQVVTKKAIIQ